MEYIVYVHTTINTNIGMVGIYICPLEYCSLIG